jgi:predicted PurR-regulated permease PerM
MKNFCSIEVRRMSDGFSTDVARPQVDLRDRLSPGFHALIVAAITISALYFGREVFVPLALAVLLAFALVPLVRLLRRWHLGRVASVVVAVLLGAALVSGLGVVIGSQVAHLAGDLPQYQYNIREKISSLRSSAAGSGIVERASTMLKDLGDEFSKSGEPAAVPQPGGRIGKMATKPQQAPVPVEIHQPDPAPLQVIQNVLGPLLQPLATTGIVVVFLIFILLAREDLRDRFIRLAGSSDMQRTTAALDDATRRLSRYLLIQSAINASFGVIIGTGLWLIGVPNPVLWGLLAMALRFVPYIGPLIAAAFPATLALAVDPGWSMLLWTLGLFLVAEPVTGQVIEPWLYGQSTGLSPVAIVVAAAFWTWLWGPIGLLLSTPLTVCLVVVGRHVERLEFLDVMLGDRPALLPEESLYQRMLAGDSDEAAEQAEQFLVEKSLPAFFDEVVSKALMLAQLDHNRGRLSHENQTKIRDTIEEILEDLDDHDDVHFLSASAAPEGTASASIRAAKMPSTPPPITVLCVAGRGTLDEAAALILVHLLERQGIGARVISSRAASAANASKLEPAGVRVVCASYLAPGTFSNARYLVRRMRRRLPSARLVVGFWTLDRDVIEQRNAATATGADLIVTSFSAALAQITAITGPAEAPVAADQHLGEVA